MFSLVSCKGKGNKYECASFRGISLLSVVGKVYGKTKEGTGAVSKEQCGFKKGRS